MPKPSPLGRGWESQLISGASLAGGVEVTDAAQEDDRERTRRQQQAQHKVRHRHSEGIDADASDDHSERRSCVETCQLHPVDATLLFRADATLNEGAEEWIERSPHEAEEDSEGSEDRQRGQEIAAMASTRSARSCRRAVKPRTSPLRPPSFRPAACASTRARCQMGGLTAPVRVRRLVGGVGRGHRRTGAAHEAARARRDALTVAPC